MTTALSLALATTAASAAAQEGAYDADPYFARAPTDPYAGSPTQAAPPRATQGQTEQAAPRALPRPLASTSAPPPRYASAPQASPAPYRAPAAPATAIGEGASRPAKDLRPLTAYVEARTGWDGPRGAVRDDGVLFGATAGFDRVIARMAGGRLHAGLLASIDLSTAERANASVVRDESGAEPVVTLTERPASETRDVEVGARLGWRTDRFGFYAMAALANRKREAETIVTPFTEAGDPDAPILTQGEVQRSGQAGLFADGWRVGAGGEARLYGPAYLHLGYRYSDYDDGGERHQVLTGLGARF